MRLHIASAATGPIGPFATAAIRPRPTPSADYPPRASHFPGGQRAWLAWRNLRNRLIHEYVEDPEDFVDALRVGRVYAAGLRAVVDRIAAWLRQLGVDEEMLA